jgi:hypothetical protein
VRIFCVFNAFFFSGHFDGCGDGVDDEDVRHPSVQNIEASFFLNSLYDFFCLKFCFKPLFHFSCFLYSHWFVKLIDLKTSRQLEIDNNTTAFQPA